MDINTLSSAFDSGNGVLAAARRRCHAMRSVERPPLHQPQKLVGLFALAELIALAKDGAWPSSERAIKWIAEAPEDRARRRRRVDRRISAVVREVLIAELPAAVAFLQGSARA